jgi:hypothetical protein
VGLFLRVPFLDVEVKAGQPVVYRHRASAAHHGVLSAGRHFAC